MSIVIGTSALIMLFALSFLLLRRFVGEQDPWVLATGAPSLGLVLLILWGALSLHFVSIQVSAGLLLVSTFLGCLKLARAVEELGQAQDWSRGRSCTLWCLPGAVLTVFFALFICSISAALEDGFFLHTSVVGLMMQGQYPPVTFAGEPFLGHFGRDLLTTMLASMTGLEFLETEWVSTVLIQLLTFFFLAHWVRVRCGYTSCGLAAAYFAYFGSFFGSHLGLADTLANNNAVAHLSLALSSYLALSWIQNGKPGTMMVAASAIGTQALVYEIHFGLVVLSLLTFCIFKRHRVPAGIALVSIALIIACVEGGVLTNLAGKLLSNEPLPQSETSWQHGNLSPKFPKDNPFHLQRNNLRPSRQFETSLRPFEADFTHSREEAPLWSREILSTLGFTVWLAPLVLLALIRLRDSTGLWFFSLGAYSVLTPSIVSFGYWDGETSRWLFCASLCFSIAFGICLAHACETPRTKVAASVGCLVVIVLYTPAFSLELSEMSHALQNPGTYLPDGSPGIVPGGSLVPEPRRNLRYYNEFSDEDWYLCAKLSSIAEGGKFLTNYPPQPPPPRGVEIAANRIANAIGLEVGLTGLLPAGLAKAPRNSWSAPLYTPTLQARSFWADPQPWKLFEMEVAWLRVSESRMTGSALMALYEMENLEQISKLGTQSVWRVNPVPPTASKAGTLKSLELDRTTPDRAVLRPRRPFRIHCQADSGGQNEYSLEFRYLVEEEGEMLVANSDDLLLAKGELAGSDSLEALLIGPIYPGVYGLEWRNTGDETWAPLAVLKFEEP